MNCIEEKCIYYKENDFNKSCFECYYLENITFIKGIKKECCLPLVIKEYEDSINEIKEYYKNIIKGGVK